jgi:16S rRNA (cytosine1402-N4)-methyltransferase
LLDEVVQYLSPQEGDAYLDLTAGYGGHAHAVLDVTKSDEAVLVDRDKDAVHALQQRFSNQSVRIEHADYLKASEMLQREGQKFDCILADIGVSSPHLDKASRGFSLRQEGPLDMRMDQHQELTAATLVNELSEHELADILRRYGEEPKARQVARAIVSNRPLHTTHQLATIVASVWPGYSRHHPASKTFQALRIAVNDELGQLEQSIPIWIELLAPGGRLAIISFHSLEDRIVKQSFAKYGGDRYDAVIRELTKRPVVASPHEVVFNPRARSAKLRVAAKIKITKPKKPG